MQQSKRRRLLTPSLISLSLFGLVRLVPEPSSLSAIVAKTLGTAMCPARPQGPESRIDGVRPRHLLSNAQNGSAELPRLPFV